MRSPLHSCTDTDYDAAWNVQGPGIQYGKLVRDSVDYWLLRNMSCLTAECWNFSAAEFDAAFAMKTLMSMHASRSALHARVVALHLQGPAHGECKLPSAKKTSRYGSSDYCELAGTVCTDRIRSSIQRLCTWRSKHATLTLTAHFASTFMVRQEKIVD